MSRQDAKERQERQGRMEPGHDVDGCAASALEAAVEVHRIVPGFLESVDEQAPMWS